MHDGSRTQAAGEIATGTVIGSESVKSPYEVFIVGETIDLVLPNRHAIDVDGWHSWFNQQDVTYHSNHGLFPNTRENQYRWLEKITNDDTRLDLLILPKGEPHVIGIVSLSQISWQHRSAHNGLIVGSKKRHKGALFHGLEAKARMAEHAFEVMGMERVWSAQVVGLQDWQKLITLFGFRPEGVWRRSHRRGYRVYDHACNSCLLEDYLRVKEARNGAYWPGKAWLLDLIRQLPKESIVEAVAEAINQTVEDYLKRVPLT
jgi:RimJ/RimL family protein N-acetyltransferase